MAAASVLCVLIAGVVGGAQLRVPALPEFGNQYAVMGLLSLPYAEIEEPFNAFYDATANKSRIDYYNGMVITIQRADQGQSGVSYKIAPLTTYKVLNKQTCFTVNGTQNETVMIQASLPNLTGFKYLKQEKHLDVTCDVWKKIEVNLGKKNTYTMLVNSDSKDPVRYTMVGYDTLLRSHYDKYIINYIVFRSGKIPDEYFDVPSNLSCSGFPGPGIEHMLTMNPMKEYIHYDHNYVSEAFHQFKMHHKKKYSSKKDHLQRKHIFRQNVRFINSKNRAGLSYTLSVNHLADLSDMERRKMRGLKISPQPSGGLHFDKGLYNLTSIPEQKNWQLWGAVTPVKDQAVCGSCWSFATTGTIEGANFLKTGNLVRLSQQELIDCSWGEGNNGCDGGEDYRSYKWIMKNGLTSEDQYGAYLAQDGYCHARNVTPVVKIANFVLIKPFDQEALKVAIAYKGPISVGIDATHKSLSFYANGVYYEPACRNQPTDLDHAVLAVGYGIMNGEPYWLIKNSWSTYWGNDGYVLMSQKNNNCGVATAASYADLL